VFCPNCGAENKETSSPCVRCGFKLSGVNASKFKGTIMLNSDETVQEMIEAQRRKMAEAAAAAAATDPTAVPPGNPNATPSPDAAAGGVPRPRRKLGGATILGVAPQLGGFKAGSPSGTLESPQREPVAGSAPEPTPEETRLPEPRRSSVPPADANAPTEAMQAFAPAAGFGATAIGGTAPQPITPEPAPAGSTQPLQGSAAPSATPFQTQASPRAALDATPPNATVPLEQLPDLRPHEPETGAAPLPPHPSGGVEAEAERVSSLPPVAKGLSASEVFLVIVTCGVYGVVRMLRQRKQP
jgi:hypothetical protein